MKTKSKLARQKRAARKVAEIMYASLQKFSEEEQERRMKEIHTIALKAGSNPIENLPSNLNFPIQ